MFLFVFVCFALFLLLFFEFKSCLHACALKVYEEEEDSNPHPPEESGPAPAGCKSWAVLATSRIFLHAGGGPAQSVVHADKHSVDVSFLLHRLRHMGAMQHDALGHLRVVFCLGREACGQWMNILIIIVQWTSSSSSFSEHPHHHCSVNILIITVQWTFLSSLFSEHPYHHRSVNILIIIVQWTSLSSSFSEHPYHHCSVNILIITVQ